MEDTPTGRELCETIHQSIRAAFVKRLPEAAERNSVCHSDVDVLRNSFWDTLKPVIVDRDSFRAHPYEKKGSQASARRLEFDGIDFALSYAQRLLNDLRLFSARSTMSYHSSLSSMPQDEFAADVVDLLLFGTFGWLVIESGADEHLQNAAGMHWRQCREKTRQQLRARGN